MPRSILNPRQTHDANATGFLNILHASKEEGVASLHTQQAAQLMAIVRFYQKLKIILVTHFRLML